MLRIQVNTSSVNELMGTHEIENLTFRIGFLPIDQPSSADVHDGGKVALLQGVPDVREITDNKKSKQSLPGTDLVGD